jgi:hypothetical protein
MASIKRFHGPNCSGDGCGCPWRLDFRPQGMKGPRKRLEFPTKKAAERFLSETSQKVTRGEYVDPRACPTFAQAAEAWFSSKAGLRPSHVSDLRSRLDKHLIPRIGTERLDRITVKAIKELRDDLQADGYASRTINTIIRIVGAVFEDAISNGECATNPVKRVKGAANRARELQPAEHGGSAEDKVDPGSILKSGGSARVIEGDGRGTVQCAIYHGRVDWGEIGRALRVAMERCSHAQRQTGIHRYPANGDVGAAQGRGNPPTLL